MKRPIRLRLWLETGMATITGLLSVITLVAPDWIERGFAVDPDARNGSLERFIVGALFVATIALILLARSEWRRAQLAAVTVRSTYRR